MNITVGNTLRYLVSDSPKQLGSVLPQVEFAMNSIINRTTSKTPFSAVYTKQPNSTVDLLTLPSPTSKAAGTWIKDYKVSSGSQKN